MGQATQGQVSLINGVLRSAQRQAPEFWTVSSKTAWPNWLTNDLQQQGLDSPELWDSLIRQAPCMLRVNTLVCSVYDYQEQLTAAGHSFTTVDPKHPECIWLPNWRGSVTNYLALQMEQSTSKTGASQQVAHGLNQSQMKTSSISVQHRALKQCTP